MTINDVSTILGAFASILAMAVIIINTVRQATHSSKLDAIAKDVTAASDAVSTVAADVKAVAAIIPAPVPVPVAGDTTLPSGIAGTLNGHTVGQGVIDYCKANGWAPLSNENYTEFPGCSQTLCDKGLLTWAPSIGVQPTSFDQG